MTAICTPGSIGALNDIVDELDPNTVLVFAGGASYGASGAARAVAGATDGRTVETISSITANPALDDVDAAIGVLRTMSPDLVIAVGGGSVMDLAKTVRSVGPHSDTALPYALGERTAGPSRASLVAIPTTAGTGSEATHFAAIYVDGRKYSIADPSMQPDHVILDPELTYSMPPAVTAVTGLDALCQAIESFWSVRSTEASRALARRAVALALGHLERAVNDPDPAARAAMCSASHLAGRAIDESFTTAPHALSYVLTSGFGVPHGHAVALTLGAVLEYNAHATEDTCSDPRGIDYVLETMADVIGMLGANDAAGARRRFEVLVASVGLDNTFAGIGAPTDEIRALLLDGVNPQRLANNPRTFTNESLAALLAGIE